MPIGYLRPVGEPVPLSVQPSVPYRWPDPFTARWVNSGTAAIAVAVRVACSMRTVASPRVVMPAYTCPDVVSAIRWGGATARLVDTQPARPWLHLDAVADALDDRVVAVIAPHFLGLRHPLEELAELCARRSILLIEDSAQLAPNSPASDPRGDFVCFSFGRGKPVPIGGGVVLHRSHSSRAVDAVLADCRSTGGGIAWRARHLLQNIAQGRTMFRLACAIPALHVGETRYSELREVTRPGSDVTSQSESLLAHWAWPSPAASTALRGLLGGSDRAQDLATELGWDGAAPLLRYPVLCRDATSRDALICELGGVRNGVSTFYGRPVFDIPGIPDCDRCGTLTSARDFAGRLITLPCHSGVQPADIEFFGDVLGARPNAASKD